MTGERGGLVTFGAALVAVAVAGVAACGVAACGGPAPRAGRAGHGSTRASTSTRPVPLTLAITPAPGSGSLPVSTEIGTTVAGGTITDVALVGPDGSRVAGSMREDGTAWVPDAPLAFAKTYSASVTARGTDGTTRTASTSFSTMAQPGGTRVGTGLYLFTGATYGVGMPVVVEFESDVPAEAQASVVRRLFVRSDPPQPGAWHWFGPRQVMYRPPVYWKAGTKLTVRAALGGHPIGRRFGDMDRSATASIGRDVRIDVDNATKQMTVYQDGAVLRTMPVSLGKPSTPSSSGTMVIMSKEESTVFDTTRTDGPRGYRMTIAYAQRLTWKGEYIHSAPWSVGDQGRRNVSHGCVNLSPGNALWLYRLSMVGDPVTVRGTERHVEPGNGWTAWDLPWSQYAPDAAGAASAPASGASRPVPLDVARTGEQLPADRPRRWVSPATWS